MFEDEAEVVRGGFTPVEEVEEGTDGVSS